MADGVTAYPLAWPDGWPRAKNRRAAPFKVTLEKALQELGWEIERMGGRLPVVSTNVTRRLDGGMSLRGVPDNGDPGVAVYFQLRGRPKVFACDQFMLVKDNIRAISKTIEALRGIERWGASELMERAFAGFDALPPLRSPWDVLGIPSGSDKDAIESAYRQKAKAAHPDAGGSNAAMAELNEARRAALATVRTDR